MNSGIVILGTVGLVCLGLVLRRDPRAIVPAFDSVWRQLLMLSLRMPLALITAAYLGLLIPPTAVAPFIGADTGLRGILLAGLFGGLIPGGPMLTFPLAMVLWRSGAGEPQMVALLSAWTIIAMNRSLSYEIPLVGLKFAAFRLASSWMMPFVAGLLALLLVNVLRI